MVCECRSVYERGLRRGEMKAQDNFLSGMWFFVLHNNDKQAQVLNSWWVSLMNDQNKKNEINYDKCTIFNGKSMYIALNKGEKALMLIWDKSPLVFQPFLGINRIKHQPIK